MMKNIGLCSKKLSNRTGEDEKKKGIEAWKCNFLHFSEIMIDRPTDRSNDRPTDPPTDRPGLREVTIDPNYVYQADLILTSASGI